MMYAFYKRYQDQLAAKQKKGDAEAAEFNTFSKDQPETIFKTFLRENYPNVECQEVLGQKQKLISTALFEKDTKYFYFGKDKSSEEKWRHCFLLGDKYDEETMPVPTYFHLKAFGSNLEESVFNLLEYFRGLTLGDQFNKECYNQVSFNVFKNVRAQYTTGYRTSIWVDGAPYRNDALAKDGEEGFVTWASICPIFFVRIGDEP